MNFHIQYVENKHISWYSTTYVDMYLEDTSGNIGSIQIKMRPQKGFDTIVCCIVIVGLDTA